MSTNDPAGRRLRGPSPEQEQIGTQQLLERLVLIERVIAHHEKVASFTPKPRSVLGVDDRLTAPLQLSHAAGYAISVAVDNLKALIALVRADAGLTIYQVAQYPLLRSAVEGAALAVWLLGPEDRQTRILRLLQARMDEVRFDQALIKRMSLVRDGDTREERSKAQEVRRKAHQIYAAKKESLATIADSRGIALAEYERGQPGWVDLVDAAAQHAFNDRKDVAAATWMALGGLTHPSSSRGLMFSVIEEFTDPVDGVHTTRISGSTQSVAMGTAAALLFLNAAQQINRDRRLRIDGSPDQVPKRPN